jgi:hypothetical protein
MEILDAVRGAEGKFAVGRLEVGVHPESINT